MLEVRPLVEVFVCRDGKLLILQRASGRGEGWWMPPGGMIERDEEPEAAAVREVMEETGLLIARLELLRQYRWQFLDDNYVRAITAYIAEAPSGELRLSDEHVAHAWTTPEKYIERFCSERLETLLPDYAGMFREERATCNEVARRLSP